MNRFFQRRRQTAGTARPKAPLGVKKIFSLPFPAAVKKGGRVLKLYTSKVVADFLDLSERRVRQLRDKGIISEMRPGLFDLRTVTRQYINYLRKDGNPEEVVDYNTERAKLVRAKRENEELELSLRKREVHRSEDIEKVMSDMLIRFKTRLMAIPAKLSPILSKKKDQTEIFKIMKAAIDEALDELADYDRMFGDGSENAGTHEDTI